MYRKGLGDCVLLGIPGRNRTFWMLVDCGLILGTANAPDKIAEIVADVARVTDKRLDALVVTHEHWDHVSGFVQAEAAFRSLAIDAVWMAWTEDPKDRLASRLRDEREARRQNLAGFVNNRLVDGGPRGLVDEPIAQGVASVLSFFNMDFSNAGFGVAGATTRDALDKARSLAPGKQPIYWRPDDAPFVPPEAPAVRIYPLGPPHDEKSLKKTFAKDEVYHLGAGEDALFAADTALRSGASWEMCCPFDRDVGAPLAPFLATSRSTAAAQPLDPLHDFVNRHYLDPDPSVAGDGGWRRIDTAWLGPASDFALALDNATNNTSLVLAIEIIDSGRVILLAADAQVGSWLSWHDRTWQVDARTVTGPDLLARTVFYKVGHHGSHNATLRAKGLELMTSPELVAFIPVDHATAVKKGWDQMPLPGLVRALDRQTKGRVLQADKDFQPGATAESQEFARELTQTNLYFEYTVPL